MTSIQNYFSEVRHKLLIRMHVEIIVETIKVEQMEYFGFSDLTYQLTNASIYLLKKGRPRWDTIIFCSSDLKIQEK